jgi:hypothetical protein
VIHRPESGAFSFYLDGLPKCIERTIAEMLKKLAVLPGKDLLLETAVELDRPEALVHFCDIGAQTGGMAKQLVVGSVLLPDTNAPRRGCLRKPLAPAYAAPHRYKVFAFRQSLEINRGISPGGGIGETVGLLMRCAAVADG